MLDERPIGSVVIPVYNGAAHLVQLIGSLQAQTLEPFEAIFVDDISGLWDVNIPDVYLAGVKNAFMKHEPMLCGELSNG